MRILEENGNIIIKESTDFDVGQTLSCGQCFHYKKVGDNAYGLAARGRLLYIEQTDGQVIFHNTDREVFENLWRPYFDLDTDYKAIKTTLSRGDAKLAQAMEAMWGVRILKQEFFETLISFIISQNKQILHIRQIVDNISRRYGPYLGSVKGEDFYGFPDAETLSGVSEEEFRSLKTGFRAPYIVDAVSAVAKGRICEAELRQLPFEECMEKLCSIKGVGRKVAGCTALFGLGKTESFPVDVWIWRIMETLYFQRKASRAEIEELAREQFKDLGGYAQQYLFYYGREMKLGVDK